MLWYKERKKGSHCPWKACGNPDGWPAPHAVKFCWANVKEKGARLMTGVSCIEFTLNKEKDDICVFCS